MARLFAAPSKFSGRLFVTSYEKGEIISGIEMPENPSQLWHPTRGDVLQGLVGAGLETVRRVGELDCALTAAASIKNSRR